MFINQYAFPSSNNNKEVFYENTPASILTEGNMLEDLNTVGNSIVSVDNTDFINGNRSIKIESTVARSGVFISSSANNLITGKTYNCSVWAKLITGSKSVIYVFNPTILVASITSTEWTEYTFSFVARSNSSIRVYSSFNGSPGDTVLIDEISILES